MIEVKRVQTGVRIEAALLKVLKGDLLEGICLHAFEGKAPFARETVAQIAQLKQIYGLTLTAADSHRLVDAPRRGATARPAVARPAAVRPAAVRPAAVRKGRRHA